MTQGSAPQQRKAYEFSLVNAFTSSEFGGNPALVVFLDAPLEDEAMYFNIARNFNQPIACFVAPATGRGVHPSVDVKGLGAEVGGTVEAETADPATVATFGLRWFTTTVESPLCGHGTLATVHALLARPETLRAAGADPARVALLRFETMHGEFTARRVAGGRIEISLPAFVPVPVSEEECTRVCAAVNRAFGREVAVKSVSHSSSTEGAAGVYVLVEIDAKEDLGGSKIDTTMFVGTSPRGVNVITAASKEPGVTYDTRMFAPLHGVQEDHTCGSANCLMAPYWAGKRGLASGEGMVVKQRSARGGTIYATVDKESQKVHLRGEATLTATGQIYL